MSGWFRQMVIEECAMKTRIVRTALYLLLLTLAAVLAFSASASENGDAVIYMPAAQVNQAFARGKPLLETKLNISDWPTSTSAWA
jgi:hypothetical protein